MKTILIAHTNSAGTGIAQCTVSSKSETQARAKFTEFYPERIITVSAERAHPSEVIKR